ncbi:hypothetical protein Pyrde_0082 [Pyrodictium delaneyi]|uniref:Uncharacterized protein n=1 Tax=Pyrodictium delaneyi TaxID=1273541 RepID=A0A0P0N1N6_9CREN|nr:hypothetical protein [Pyrodictium delaneyi]ALL00132.1 hypothetical protein Pyrde_0082 [Pyrodictium delaneyi]
MYELDPEAMEMAVYWLFDHELWELLSDIEAAKRDAEWLKKILRKRVAGDG